MQIDGQKLTANASIGVAIYPNDATDAEKLICNADAALYRAKAEGPGSIGSLNLKWIASCASIASFNMTSDRPLKTASSNLSINPKT